jgi:hypothetical protein
VQTKAPGDAKVQAIDNEGGACAGTNPTLPDELLLKIRSYLTEKPYSYEKLVAIINWCAHSKRACDESVYHEVVTMCIGVPVTNIPMNTGTGMWYNIMIQCKKDLSRLPASMRSPFLNSNEAQRARWRGVFERRGLVWLKDRVLLGGPITVAPYPNYTANVIMQAFETENEDEQMSLKVYLIGRSVPPRFKTRVDGWIQEGWEFDWVLGNVFEKGLKPIEWDGDEDDEDEGYKMLEAAQTCVMEAFTNRVEALIAAGADPSITGEQLMRMLPDTDKDIEYEQNYKFRFLHLKVDLMLIHKIFVWFNDGYGDVDYYSHNVFTRLTRLYFLNLEENSLTEQLSKLIVHLASRQGSDVYQKVGHSMLQIFVQNFLADGQHTDASRLYERMYTLYGKDLGWPHQLPSVDQSSIGWSGSEYGAV